MRLSQRGDSLSAMTATLLTTGTGTIMSPPILYITGEY